MCAASGRICPPFVRLSRHYFTDRHTVVLGSSHLIGRQGDMRSSDLNAAIRQLRGDVDTLSSAVDQLDKALDRLREVVDPASKPDDLAPKHLDLSG